MSDSDNNNIRVLSVCICMRDGGGLLFFTAHEPVDLQMNVQSKNKDGSSETVRMRFCKRCGVTYVDQHARQFAQATTLTLVKDPPKDDPPKDKPS